MLHAMVQRQLFVFFFCVGLLMATSAIASFYEDESLDPSSFLDIGSDLLCKLAKCVNGQCMNSSSFPFYKCECNAGWQSPFRASWLPCVLPNCSIDLACDNRSAAAPAPSASVPSFSGSSDICSFPVCGNGQCIQNSSLAGNDTNDYECVCDSGYINLGNKVDGYCIRKCSLGAGCTNVSLPIGGTSNTPSPPPPATTSPSSSSSPPSVNQGTSSSSPSPGQTPTPKMSEGHLIAAGNLILAVVTSIALTLR